MEPVALNARYRAAIPPVEDGVHRPRWSVMIPTFNCARYLKQTLEGVLAQDPGASSMQIEVVDDCSTSDDPQAVVQEVGRGRIEFFRHPTNVGHIRNFNTCLSRARGQLVHLLHGDDFVKPGFYRKMEMAFECRPDLGAAFCRQVFIDEDNRELSVSEREQPESGLLDNWMEKLASEQRIMTPSIVVPRSIYEEVGGFDSRLVCSEDWEMWMRIAARHPVWYEVEPLAHYRMHLHSNTGRHVRSGEDISFTCKAIDLFSEYLPQPLARRVSRRAKRTYALVALDQAERLYAAGDAEAGAAQVRAALTCSRSMPILIRLARLQLKRRRNLPKV